MKYKGLVSELVKLSEKQKKRFPKNITIGTRVSFSPYKNPMIDEIYPGVVVDRTELGGYVVYCNVTKSLLNIEEGFPIASEGIASFDDVDLIGVRKTLFEALITLSMTEESLDRQNLTITEIESGFLGETKVEMKKAMRKLDLLINGVARFRHGEQGKDSEASFTEAYTTLYELYFAGDQLKGIINRNTINFHSLKSYINKGRFHVVMEKKP